MTYTLRLLTAQQFQRATALISACELLRRERVAAGDLRCGGTPSRIGLRVGIGVTPNTFDDALRQLEDATARAGEGQVGGLQQFATCPRCGNGIDLGCHGHADRQRRRCSCSAAIRTGAAPSATPSRTKGYRPASSTRRSTRSPRPAHRHRRQVRRPARSTAGAGAPAPIADPIIQDELHLISDALGSLVGLYEALVDALCTRRQDGQPVRPVFVASTATVRGARAQVQQVFARALGHSTVTLSHDRYGHLFGDELDRLADRLDQDRADFLQTDPP